MACVTACATACNGLEVPSLPGRSWQLCFPPSRQRLSVCFDRILKLPFVQRFAAALVCPAAVAVRRQRSPREPRISLLAASEESEECLASAQFYHVVGDFCDWEVQGAPVMAIDASLIEQEELEALPPRLIWRAVMQRSRHEFQILRDGSWDKRLYPADSHKAFLQPGGSPTHVAGDFGGGHNLNFVLEASPGTAFDIFYDPDSGTISCQYG
eukprot:TRINITY_DN69537_c0_g1_i1.p1 TRINITY_DN69537_c0_g1~~TRINITY_DN69537_c0_g1_i1.p1  ORF type:complete len:212 (-),score=28.72 TRINITY_DN69537_c0_g1_i1:40-675(-)